MNLSKNDHHCQLRANPPSTSIKVMKMRLDSSKDRDNWYEAEFS